MASMVASAFFKNASLVTDVLGGWPDFHDAEVLSLTLDRSGPGLTLILHTWRTLPETDERGYFKRVSGIAVTLAFHHVADIELSGFNEQNVLCGLSFERDAERILVSLTDTYGLGGSFTCDAADVLGVEPMAPT